MDLDSKIFLSHSKHDEEDVKHLRDWLLDLGLNSFVSFDNIRRLEFWKLLAKELRASACLLLIMTRNSLESTNVHKEIILADKYKKKIFIYQVEEVAEFPEEVDAILTPIQRIESYKHGTSEGLKRLAEMLLVEAGLGDDEIKEKIDGAIVSSQEKQRKAKFELQSNLERWKDEYLDYKWNGKHLKGVLAGIEIEHLHDLASQLGLSRAETEKLQVLGKRDRKKFMDLLNGTLNKTDIRAKDIFTLEDRRIKYEVSRKEVREVVEKRSKIPRYSLDKIDAGSHSYRNIDWLLESLSKKKKELEQSAHNRLRASADAPRKEPEQLSTAQKSDSKNASMVSTPSVTDQAAVQSTQASNDNDQEVTVQAAKTRKGKDAETHQHKPRRDQDNKDYEAIDSTLNSGTRPSKPRLRRFFNCNDQFLVVSEIFLGNEIKRLDVTHIERTDDFFIFDGRIVPSATKIGASSAIIRSIDEQNTQIKTTSKFTQIIVSEFTIKFVQEGFESYVVASVDPVKDNYARFIAFLEGVGIPVSKVETQQHPEHPAVKRRREAEELKNNGVQDSLKKKTGVKDTNVNIRDKLNEAEAIMPSSSQKKQSNSDSLDTDALINAITEYSSLSLSEELSILSKLAIANSNDLSLYVNPELASKSQTSIALKKHQIKGDYLGKVLVHWNTSILRSKNGLIIFEKGMLVSSFLEKTRLFYFSNLDHSKEAWSLVYDGDNEVKVNVDGYCGVEGLVVSTSQTLHKTLPDNANNLISLLGSLLNKAIWKSECLFEATNAIVDRFDVSLKINQESVLYFPDNIYKADLTPKSPFVDHYKIFKESFGVYPIPSEVIMLLDCGITQSVLVTTFGLHLIGKAIFPVKMRLDFLSIPWSSFRSIRIEATDYSAKIIYFSVVSGEYTGIIKFNFKDRESSFAGFAADAHEFLNLIGTAAGLYSRI
jgi:hypothetical protein